MIKYKIRNSEVIECIVNGSWHIELPLFASSTTEYNGYIKFYDTREEATIVFLGHFIGRKLCINGLYYIIIGTSEGLRLVPLPATVDDFHVRTHPLPDNFEEYLI